MNEPTTTSHVDNALFNLYDSLSDEKKAVMREVFSDCNSNAEPLQVTRRNTK